MDDFYDISPEEYSGETTWLPMSDMMTGLMIIFLMIALILIPKTDLLNKDRTASIELTEPSQNKTVIKNLQYQIKMLNEAIVNHMKKAHLSNIELEEKEKQLANLNKKNKEQEQRISELEEKEKQLVNLNKKNIAIEWEDLQKRIYNALDAEFSDDLQRWNAELDISLLIRFKSPEILFGNGNAIITKRYQAILSDFFPRYVKVLAPFNAEIEEVRIDGHTSSKWAGARSELDAYIKNMELSQNRARSVLAYSLNLEFDESNRKWIRNKLTANGLSSSKPIFNSQKHFFPQVKKEDEKASRRVEFRVRTNTEERLIQIINQSQ